MNCEFTLNQFLPETRSFGMNFDWTTDDKYLISDSKSQLVSSVKVSWKVVGFVDLYRTKKQTTIMSHNNTRKTEL